MGTGVSMTPSLHPALRALQSDYAIFYQKLRTYQLTVHGPEFLELRELFEKLYAEAADVQNNLAERMLALDLQPVKTLQDQLAPARLKEDPAAPDARGMLTNVLSDVLSLRLSLRELASQASQLSDIATANLAGRIAGRNEEKVWTLCALLSKATQVSPQE